MRCPWSEKSDTMRSYHDTEWGTPQRDDQILFEYILLDSFQAGLSWATILNKRENFRKAFDSFDPNSIALYGKKKVDSLLKNEGIVRHRGKIEATIGNAKTFLTIQEEYGSFSAYLWSWVNEISIQNQCKNEQDVPTHTELSDTISADLKKRGFRFFGSTICYAFLQGCGVVNDHLTTCDRFKSLS
ncbi:MAG: DNA-3-methyladenine glycosylase I [bacterium]|nr:DNA-3-methyladenine glycosylase I [bacterium]